MARTAVLASPALRLVPSGRSLAIGFGLLAAAFGLFFAARETAVFAVHEVQVESVPSGQSRMVDRALLGLQGTSLLRIDQEDIQRRLDKLPHVHLLGYDRAFPNTLRVEVSVERPVAVVRRGDENWLVSAEGRVLRPLERRLRRPLPVVWIGRTVDPHVGSILGSAEAARAIRTVAAIRAAAPGLSPRVWYVKTGEGGTAAAVLDDRFEIRLGSASDLPLKLAVSRRVLATLRREGDVAAYLDVSVPERPVVGESIESQVEPETAAPEDALTGQ
ncbi:MAG TPA: cell division protein FtsQ/DivIB [Gaiellaceae bacterium]|nr:cell division protein FtsQ/DivIB [Gaiellaceae bacterium]